jgi:hypothetical protein
MAFHYIYDNLGYLTGAFQGTASPDNSTTLTPIYPNGGHPQFVDGAWLTSGGNLKPTPPQFMLLLTLMERVGIRAARDTNVVVDDLLRMLEDPRLTVVELVDPSVIEALNYMTTTTPQLLTPARVARILTGLSAQT